MLIGSKKVFTACFTVSLDANTCAMRAVLIAKLWLDHLVSAMRNDIATHTCLRKKTIAIMPNIEHIDSYDRSMLYTHLLPQLAHLCPEPWLRVMAAVLLLWPWVITIINKSLAALPPSRRVPSPLPIDITAPPPDKTTASSTLNNKELSNTRDEIEELAHCT